jgi:Prohead core protein serine protease
VKLIREEVTDVQYLVEEKDGKKNYFVEGIFCQAEKQNRNGRVYPYSILNREVERYNKEYVTKNRAFGELGHPDTPSINLDRVSHMITSLRPDGNNFIGKAKIVDTPMGNTVKGLLESGANLGVSTRGVGSLKPHNGYQLVQDDFKLATAADIVADPSAPDAFVHGIMENYDWWMDNGGNWHKRFIEEARQELRTLSKRQIEAKALTLFENYIRKL